MESKEELQICLAKTRLGKHLSEYHFKLLKRHKINTATEFLDATNVHKLLALGPEEVELIKRELLELFVRNVTLKTLYGNSSISYATGIEEVDKLLESIGQPLRPGRVWEIYGETGVGKTEFLHTLAANFVSEHKDKYQVLYIDTKHDFNAERLQQILLTRQLDEETIKICMNAVQVMESQGAESLIAALETMIEKLSNCDETMSRIKLILVDSLAASFMLLRSNGERNNGRIFLTKLAMLLRKLASQHGIACVLGNLSIISNDEFDDDENNDDCLTQSSAEAQDDFSLMGDYWDSVCTLTMTLELPEDSANSDGLRLLKVLNNSYGCSGSNCLLSLTDAGVV